MTKKPVSIFIGDDRNANWPKRTPDTMADLTGFRHVPAGVAVIKDWDPDLHPRDANGEFGEGGGEAREPNRQIVGDIYEIHNATGLPDKFRTVVVGVVGNNKGQMYGSTIGTTHDVVLRAAGKGNEIDNFVRFSYDYKDGYEANTIYAGRAYNNLLSDEDNAKDEQLAIANIYAAADMLRGAGLSEDTPLAILTSYGQGGPVNSPVIRTTFAKMLSDFDLLKEYRHSALLKRLVN